MITTFVTQTELRKRAGGISNRTFRNRIAIAGIVPDGVLLEKSRHQTASALWNVANLPALRRALMLQKNPTIL